MRKPLEGSNFRVRQGRERSREKRRKEGSEEEAPHDRGKLLEVEVSRPSSCVEASVAPEVDRIGACGHRRL